MDDEQSLLRGTDGFAGPASSPAAAETVADDYAEEFALNDIGLALRLQSFAEGA